MLWQRASLLSVLALVISCGGSGSTNPGSAFNTEAQGPGSNPGAPGSCSPNAPTPGKCGGGGEGNQGQGGSGEVGGQGGSFGGGGSGGTGGGDCLSICTAKASECSQPSTGCSQFCDIATTEQVNCVKNATCETVGGCLQGSGGTSGSGGFGGTSGFGGVAGGGFGGTSGFGGGLGGVGGGTDCTTFLPDQCAYCNCLYPNNPENCVSFCG